jgi:dTDP-4-amino-4,6-dideoxygalactose transaminase
MGEGGALVLNHKEDLEPAEILREKGTDRARFFRGQVDKYTWVEYGSSYLPSDMLAAYLWAQLQEADRINENRLATWNAYNEAFSPLAAEGKLVLPTIPEECAHNAHMYYVKLKDLRQRTDFINYLRDRDVSSVFHYVPLHSSPAGRRFGRFCGEDVYTTAESDRLTRLPMYYGLSAEDRDRVIEAVLSYFA